MSKKYYRLSKHYFKGTEYSTDLTQFYNDDWGSKSGGYEEVDKLRYIQVDEYDSNNNWLNRERYMVDDWYKELRAIPIIKRIIANHPEEEGWEYKGE